jgi:FAD/FMN-containing dehydrogenase
MSVQTTRRIGDVIEQLRSSVTGRLITPDDPDYDDARHTFVGGIDHRPAVIVRPAEAEDVARAVSIAAEGGIELSVRSGGHSAVGHCVSEGGIMLDLHDLRAIDIDVVGRTVWADAGLTAREVSEATNAHGLAVGFGDTGSVGIGGITTGGGVGYLARKYGLTIDSLLAAEVVTADGQVRVVDAGHEPDLFWAIRGGGGNFGVVTRFQYRLQEVGTVYGGMLMIPASAEVVGRFVALAEAAPEELSTIGNVMPAPPMPFIPAEQHGKLVIMALVVHVGDAAAGEKAVAPFRALATPVTDMLRPMPYPEIYPPDDDSYHPTAVNHTMFVDSIDDKAAATIVRYLTESNASLRVAQIRVLGGAVNRVPADATAYAHRSSRIMVNLAAFYEGPDDKIVRQQWLRDFAAAIEQGDKGAYVNFLTDEGPDRVRAAYPGGTWERLVALKKRYDPTNLFHLNQNIPPA